MGFLSSFADLNWRIYLACTSKTWSTWKLIVLLSELGGQLPPLPPWLRAWPQPTACLGPWSQKFISGPGDKQATQRAISHDLATYVMISRDDISFYVTNAIFLIRCTAACLSDSPSWPACDIFVPSSRRRMPIRRAVCDYAIMVRLQ